MKNRVKLHYNSDNCSEAMVNTPESFSNTYIHVVLRRHSLHIDLTTALDDLYY